MLKLPKPRRVVDEDYLDFVRGQRCCVPGCRLTEPSDPHHGVTRGAGGSDFYGKVKSIQVYKTALSDPELPSISASDPISRPKSGPVHDRL